MRYDLKSGNYTEMVKDTDQFMDLWPFFQEGREAINKRMNVNIGMDPYMRRMLSCIYGCPDAGICVLYSKSGKKLGFGCAANTTTEYSECKTLFIYFMYSNGLYLNTTKDLITWLRLFAKQNDYKRIVTETGHVSGGAVRFYQRKLGFTSRRMVFELEV